MPFDRPRADEELRADLRVRAPVARKLSDVLLLGRELVTSFNHPPAHDLTCGEQFATRAVSKAVHPVVEEHLVRQTKLFARIRPPALATQPFAVQEVRAGKRHVDASAFEAFNRLSV